MIALNKRVGSVLGIFIFCIPVALFLLWIYANEQTSGYPENVNLYQSYFPEFLRGRFTTTIISIFSCVLTILLNLRNLGDSNRLMRIVSWVFVIAAGLLGFLNLFSMM